MHLSKVISYEGWLRAREAYLRYELAPQELDVGYDERERIFIPTDGAMRV